MKIRKLFKFEASHIVRNCSSVRCRASVHGHSYKVEVFFTSDKLDNGQMIYDFGLTKGTVGKFIDCFDHCWHYWNKDCKELISSVHTLNERWIELPFSPSAENYAIYFMKVINYFLENMEMKNGEEKIVCCGVRVHETDTGYAESEPGDEKLVNYQLSEVKFSPAIVKEVGEDILTFKD